MAGNLAAPPPARRAGIVFPHLILKAIDLFPPGKIQPGREYQPPLNPEAVSALTRNFRSNRLSDS